MDNKIAGTYNLNKKSGKIIFKFRIFYLSCYEKYFDEQNAHFCIIDFD